MLKEMQVEDRDFKVGIIGRVKVGKSLFLNVLIFEGVEVLFKVVMFMIVSFIILKYVKILSVEVEFYSLKDILEFKNEYVRYEREFNRIVDEEVKR